MNNNKKPRILVLDIETSPVKGYVWSLWQQNLGLDQIVETGKVLCYASKFLDEKKVVWRRHDDIDFLTHIYDRLDSADAIISYNGRRFDLPWLNTEFVKAGLTPPSPYKHIDLLETAKKQFRFASNKLQHLLTELKIGTKKDHEGFPMWVKCLANEKQAWKDMEAYNRQDVSETIKLYERLKPWLVSHPNMALYAEARVCPFCGSNHLHSRGPYRSNVSLYRRFKCVDCGSWSRTRFTEVDKEARKDILVAAL